MAYRIVYGPEPKVAQRKKSGIFRLQMMTAVFLFLFALLVRTYWPAGSAKLSRYLLPGEPEITQQALDGMMKDLGNGIPLGDAVTAFCEQIISNEKASD